MAMVDEGRRKALSTLAGSALGLILPARLAWAGADEQDFWARPRRLRLYRPSSREMVDEVYWADGKISAEGYVRISHLLRDVQANQSVYMDPRLLDLMCAIQGYMAFYGFKQPLSINSGYRSLATNGRTEGAAKNSMHVKGRAVDFTMPGVPSSYLGQLASHYQGGGVGFYPAAGFTHLDTGSVRYWGDGASRRPKIAAQPR